MFIIRDKITKEIIRKSETPLRLDGKLPEGLVEEVLVESWEDVPVYNQSTHKAERLIREEVVASDEPIKLIYGWTVRALTPEELAISRKFIYQPAQNYQVRAWMIRGGLSPETVPTIINQVVPESVPGGIGRAEALMRWDYAVTIPRDFPLVDTIGAQMNMTPQQIDAEWSSILSL